MMARRKESPARKKVAKRSQRSRGSKAKTIKKKTNKVGRTKATITRRQSSGSKQSDKNYTVVRLAGTGQYRLDHSSSRKLAEIDSALLKIIEGNEAKHGSDTEFRNKLSEMISLVLKNGKKLNLDDIVPSDFIVPDASMSVKEAKELLNGERLSLLD
jgi:hypothetical protein